MQNENLPFKKFLKKSNTLLYIFFFVSAIRFSKKLRPIVILFTK